MSTIRYFNRLAVIATAATLGGLVLNAHAGEQGTARAGKTSASVACDQAREFSWFKRQLQLTDGDANPFVKIDTPAECKRVEASNATGPSTVAAR